MKLARTIHFDDSDMNVFARPAATGEWAIPGGFAFSNVTEAELSGKARQAFSNGWLGLESFGRATLVAVAQIEESELEALIETLAVHFENVYGAAPPEAARRVARQEMTFMQELCEDQDPNTLIAVSRSMTEAGVREQFRAITSQDADLDMVAVHADPE